MTDVHNQHHGRTAILRLGPPILLALAIVALWMGTYGKLNRVSWQYPPLYRGDALYELGIIRAASFGYYCPGLWKTVPTLGAPDRANWSDYPQTEDLHYAFFGVLAALLGLMPAANLALLIAFVLNGIGFYWACRLLHYRILWSLIGALLYACSHYAYARGFGHLELTYYAHLPLAIVATWWLASGAVTSITTKRAVLVLAIAACSGFQNAYYSYILAQLIGLSILVNIVRIRKDRAQFHTARIGGVALAVLLLGLLLGNIDTITYKWSHGPNLTILSRTYGDAERLALKPIELFLPYHRDWTLINDIHAQYLRDAVFVGEFWAPYLGVVGIFGLIALAVFSFVRAAHRSKVSSGMPVGAWQVGWVFLLSVAGGINSIVAFCGFPLFRATNRYSIVILTIVLLFFVRMMTLWTRRWSLATQTCLALAILCVGLIDQVFSKDVADLRSRLDSDRKFCAILESKLPPGSAIFQLPVAEYPERGAIGKMGDYEHLRPFLYCSSLRFSYGDDKGRKPADSWDQKIEAMRGSAAIAQLREKAFVAVIINRDGYVDRGDALVSRLEVAGAAVITEADNADLIALNLP